MLNRYGLRFENAFCGQRILYLLEGGENRLAICGDSCIVGRLR